MHIEVVPSLEVQRDLLALPRGMERFEAYVSSMVGPDDEVLLPLFLFNPMAREHVAEVLDGLIASGAERIAADAAAASAALLDGDDRVVRTIVMVVDDALGGWTNRYSTDYELRCTTKSGFPDWIVVPVWSSEGVDVERVRADTTAAVGRYAHVAEHGWPSTLDEVMRQEGTASAFAGRAPAALDAEELAYSREVIAPFRDGTGWPVHFPCLYGDVGAESMGYQALGLAPWAGFAVAHDDALARAD